MLLHYLVEIPGGVAVGDVAVTAVVNGGGIMSQDSPNNITMCNIYYNKDT